MLTVYTTPTCAPCRVAKNRLKDAGIAHNTVDLTENPEELARLKDKLGGVAFVQTPLFEHGDELYDITGLSTVIELTK